MVASHGDLKLHVLEMLENLPEESLVEVATFLDYQQYKLGKQRAVAATYRPIPLGGLWRGARVGDDEIADVRREMWARFAAHEP
jgi:hypothetical protein